MPTQHIQEHTNIKYNPNNILVGIITNSSFIILFFFINSRKFCI